jgi:hypothetical protein
MSVARKHVVVVALSAASLFLALGASANDEPIRTSCTPPIKCCRVCTKGKACGNSCIEESKVCHKSKGCACNAADVCAEDP